MPRLYHGLVKRECLEKIYKRTGSYFPGPSPDMANATAICLEIEKSAYIHDYAIVSGYGHDSAKGEGNRGEHYGDLTKKPWLPKDILDRWNPELPAIFSAETIIAQSLTEAIQRYNRNDLLLSFPYGKFYATFLWHHKDAANQMVRFLLKKPIRLIKMISGLLAKILTRRSEQDLFNSKSNYLEYPNVDSLKTAKEYTEKLSEKILGYSLEENN